MVLKLPSIQIIANTDLNDELPPNSSFVYSCTVHNTGKLGVGLLAIVCSRTNLKFFSLTNAPTSLAC